MHNSSTILTVGTALRHAQDGAVQVHVLVGGTWMTGLVIGVDGEGAVLETDDGDTTVVRIQAVTAVRVEQVIRQRPPSSATSRPRRLRRRGTRRARRSPRTTWSATGSGTPRTSSPATWCRCTASRSRPEPRRPSGNF